MLRCFLLFQDEPLDIHLTACSHDFFLQLCSGDELSHLNFKRTALFTCIADHPRPRLASQCYPPCIFFSPAAKKGYISLYGKLNSEVHKCKYTPKFLDRLHIWGLLKLKSSLPIVGVFYKWVKIRILICHLFSVFTTFCSLLCFCFIGDCEREYAFPTMCNSW